MWCMHCDKAFPGECTCEDRDERLARLARSQHFTYAACKVCGKHIDLCRCNPPQAGWSHDFRGGDS